MNTRYGKRSHSGPFTKRSTIGILLVKWHLCLFVILMICESFPSYVHSETGKPREIRKKTSDSGFVLSESIGSQNKPGIVSSLDKSVQLLAERINHFTALIGAFILGVPCVGEEMIDTNDNQRNKDCTKAELTYDNNWLLIHAFSGWFLFRSWRHLFQSATHIIAALTREHGGWQQACLRKSDERSRVQCLVPARGARRGKALDEVGAAIPRDAVARNAMAHLRRDGFAQNFKKQTKLNQT